MRKHDNKVQPSTPPSDVDTWSEVTLHREIPIDQLPSAHYTESKLARELLEELEKHSEAVRLFWVQRPDRGDPETLEILAIHYRTLKKLVRPTITLDLDQQALIHRMIDQISIQSPTTIVPEVAALRLLPLATYINSLA